MAWYRATKPTCREMSGGDHKFEARYEEVPASAGSIKIDGTAITESLRKLLYYNTYVRDVCVYCGKTIERN